MISIEKVGSLDMPNRPLSAIPRLQLLTSYQREILEHVSRDAPVADALNALVRAARALRGESTRAAVFIFDPAKANLRFAAATGLAEEYTKVVDGFAVGPMQPSCGRAAYIGDDVIVRDVATDPYWVPFLELAQQHGIRACWSFLLKCPDGKPLGTFALYHSQPCEPDQEDYDEIGYFAKIATLLIHRHVTAQAKASMEESLRIESQNKDKFLVTLAHELRNPLSALKNAVTVVQLSRDQAVPRERALEVMARQVTQMESLIEDLIDSNRIARGEMKLNKQRIELNTIVQLAIETTTQHCERKAQMLTVTVPAHTIHMIGDATRVTQIIANLLTNASKFTDRGGHIELSVTTVSSEVQIKVRDNGIGIPSEKLLQIFDMFSQLGELTDRVQTGLGIGLALARDLAAMHGGHIEAHSEGVGKGSEFILRLPIVKSEFPTSI